jgi:hypothetical protein
LPAVSGAQREPPERDDSGGVHRRRDRFSASAMMPSAA